MVQERAPVCWLDDDIGYLFLAVSIFATTAGPPHRLTAVASFPVKGPDTLSIGPCDLSAASHLAERREREPWRRRVRPIGRRATSGRAARKASDSIARAVVGDRSSRTASKRNLHARRSDAVPRCGKAKGAARRASRKKKKEIRSSFLWLAAPAGGALRPRHRPLTFAGARNGNGST
jgi:hypothetical protein